MRTGQEMGKTHTYTVVTGPVSPTQIKPIIPDYETRSMEKEDDVGFNLCPGKRSS